MHDDEFERAFNSAGVRLGEAVDRLAGDLLALDESRQTCLRVAERCEDFARRVSADHPCLAAPASRLAELYFDLNFALGRLAATTEQLAGASGRAADAMAAYGGTAP